MYTTEELDAKKTLLAIKKDPHEIMGWGISGVYVLFSGETVIYVGQSSHVPSRIADHKREGRFEFDSVAFIPGDRDELLDMEAHYIDLLQPEANETGSRARLRRYLDQLEADFVWTDDGV